MSSQGDMLIGKVDAVEGNIPIVCIQVVPRLDGVEITTSPGRNVNRSHRALSAMTPGTAARGNVSL